MEVGPPWTVPPVGSVKYQSGIWGRLCPARNVTAWISLMVSSAQTTVSPTRTWRFCGRYLITAALWNTTLPHAAEVAPSSAVGPAATFTNQPAAGIRSCPGPLKLGGWLMIAVPAALPSGPAVRLFRVNVAGLNITLKSKPVVGATAPRSEEHTSELQSQSNLVCRLLLEKKKKNLQNKIHLDVMIDSQVVILKYNVLPQTTNVSIIHCLVKLTVLS